MVMSNAVRRSMFVSVCLLTILGVWAFALWEVRWGAALTATAGFAVIVGVLRGTWPQGASAAPVDNTGAVPEAAPADALRLAVADLDAAAEALSGAAAELQESTSANDVQSQVTAAAAETMLNDVSSSSSMSEELAAAMRVIATDSAEVARNGSEAASLVATTSTSALKLGESSNEIESVLRQIGKIAGQTNMLALNATIEAARSGEAGKGFKVVANEVKELSRATNVATKDIELRVQAMQSDSSTVLQAIEQIAAVITHVNASQATIAASVAQNASSELDQRLGEAVSGAMAIAMNLGTIGEASARSTASATQVIAGIEAVRLATRAVMKQLELTSHGPLS